MYHTNNTISFDYLNNIFRNIPNCIASQGEVASPQRGKTSCFSFLGITINIFFRNKETSWTETILARNSDGSNLNSKKFFKIYFDKSTSLCEYFKYSTSINKIDWSNSTCTWLLLFLPILRNTFRFFNEKDIFFSKNFNQYNLIFSLIYFKYFYFGLLFNPFLIEILIQHGT